MKKLFASFALTALFSATAATAGNTSQIEKDSVATVAADTTVRKKGFINKVLAYFNDANKTDYSKNSTSASSEGLTTAPTQSLVSDLLRRDFTEPTATTPSCLRPT